MKNILIIAKMNLFSKEISQNRYSFLKFLDSKSNIRVIEDLPRHINKTLSKQKELGFDVDIIIYYALSYAQQWRDIKVIKFEKCKLKKYLFFEDYLYINYSSEMFKTYKFDELILTGGKKDIISEYKKVIKKTPIIWGHFIDTEVFKQWDLEKKYTLLMYGYCQEIAYPLRSKIKFFMEKILERYPESKIKIVEHPGYKNVDLSKTIIKTDLSKLINESKFTITTSSMADVLVKKYIEIPLSGSVLVGDIPDGYKDLLQDNIIEIPRDSENDDILKTLIDIMNGKYDYMLDPQRITNFSIKLQNIYNYEKGYNKLLQILNISR